MMKKKFIVTFLALMMIFSIFCASAFACQGCFSDSRSIFSRTATIKGIGVNIRPCHNLSTTYTPPLYVNTGDVGVASYLYPSTGAYEFVYMTMNNGRYGWVYSSYVELSEF